MLFPSVKKHIFKLRGFSLHDPFRMLRILNKVMK